jgi:hypothetical protein
MSASSIISGKGGRLLVVSPSTCFTDTGATTNASVGDAVASVSGGGMYLQAPTGTKPYLRQASGVYYLEFGVDAALVHTTVGVTYNSDHARGIVMSSSSTSYPHFWRTYNPAHGVDRSAVSTLTYFAGQPIAYWGNYNGSEVHDIWNGSAVGSGITGITTCRRGTLSTLRVNGAQTNSATFTPGVNYYPSHSSLAASSSEGFNVYAVWDVPTTLSDAEALEIENDLGTQAGASWASTGATSAITATTANAVGSLTSQASPLSAIAATTANLTAAWTSSTGAASSVITATTANTVGALTSTGSTSNGTFTSEVLRDNTGTIVASKALNHVALYNDTTGALVVRKTGLSTNGLGVFTFTDAALTAGTTYRVDWEDVDGRRRMPRKAAT